MVVRVHPQILHAQGIPEELLDNKTVWEERYRSIVDLEKHLLRVLSRSNTRYHEGARIQP